MHRRCDGERHTPSITSAPTTTKSMLLQLEAVEEVRVLYTYSVGGLEPYNPRNPSCTARQNTQHCCPPLGCQPQYAATLCFQCQLCLAWVMHHWLPSRLCTVSGRHLVFLGSCQLPLPPHPPPHSRPPTLLCSCICCAQPPRDCPGPLLTSTRPAVAVPAPPHWRTSHHHPR